LFFPAYIYPPETLEYRIWRTTTTKYQGIYLIPAIYQAVADVAVATVARAHKAARHAGQVVKMTLARLPSDHRFILSAYYPDGRTLKQIASLLGVHESTVSRLLSRLTASLRKQIVGELGKTGMSRREVEEVMEVDVRDLEIQVRKILQGETIPTFQDQQAITVEGGESDV
jgi:AraC-like DNA-binding protein